VALEFKPRPDGTGSVWWGEAIDEPAREDARPTRKGKCEPLPDEHALTWL